jgi:hypothetical protein
LECDQSWKAAKQQVLLECVQSWKAAKQ